MEKFLEEYLGRMVNGIRFSDIIRRNFSNSLRKNILNSLKELLGMVSKDNLKEYLLEFIGKKL